MTIFTPKLLLLSHQGCTIHYYLLAPRETPLLALRCNIHLFCPILQIFRKCDGETFVTDSYITPSKTLPFFSVSISRWQSTESTWTKVLSGQKTNFFCNCKKHDASYILSISVYLLEKSNNRQKMGKRVLVTPFLKRRQKVVQRAQNWQKPSFLQAGWLIFSGEWFLPISYEDSMIRDMAIKSRGCLFTQQ